MTRRQQLLASLLQRTEEHDWHGCREVLFLLLYGGLPASVQLNLASFVIYRYLPIFEHKRPNVKWPATVLSNVDAWLAVHGRGLPGVAADFDAADAAFVFAFDALLLAAKYQDDELTLTSSCAAAVSAAINARQTNVWIADDPEGVAMWEEQKYFPGRSVVENPPAIAAAQREWGEVAAWLMKQTLWIETETPVNEIESGLARWNEHEMLLMVPKK